MSQKDSVGISLQSAIGTKRTTMDYWPPVTAEDLDIDVSEVKLDEAFGVRAPSDTDLGARTVKGKVEGAVRAASFGAFLSACFGEPDTTETVTDKVWTHVWDSVAVGMEPLPLSIMSVNGDVSPAIVELYWGLMVDSLELSCASGDYLMMVANVLGLGLDADQAAPSVTRDSSKKIRWDQIAAEFAEGSDSLATIKLSDYTASYNNSIEIDAVPLGVTNPEGATAGDVTLDGTFTVLEDLADHRERFLLADPANCKLKLSATGPLIGTDPTHHYALTTELARIRYTSAPVDISGKDTLKNVKVAWRASLDETTGKLITITLVNGEDGTKYLQPGGAS